MSYNLIDLLENKSFDKLNESERNFVLSKMAEVAYRRQHETVLMAKTILDVETAALMPNPTIPTAALAAMKAKQERKTQSGIFYLFKHKVPTWAAAAACALFLLLLNNSFLVSPGQGIDSAIASLSPDTVYVEKYITEVEQVYVPGDTVIKVVYRTLEKPIEKIQEQHVATVIYSDEMLNAEHINYSSIVSGYNKTKGVSVSDDSLVQLVNASIF